MPSLFHTPRPKSRETFPINSLLRFAFSRTKHTPCQDELLHNQACRSNINNEVVNHYIIPRGTIFAPKIPAHTAKRVVKTLRPFTLQPFLQRLAELALDSIFAAPKKPEKSISYSKIRLGIPALVRRPRTKSPRVEPYREAATVHLSTTIHLPKRETETDIFNGRVPWDRSTGYPLPPFLKALPCSLFALQQQGLATMLCPGCRKRQLDLLFLSEKGGCM